MTLGGVGRDDQAVGDLAIRVASRDQRRDLALARRQQRALVVASVAGGWARERLGCDRKCVPDGCRRVSTFGRRPTPRRSRPRRAADGAATRSCSWRARSIGQLGAPIASRNPAAAPSRRAPRPASPPILATALRYSSDSAIPRLSPCSRRRMSPSASSARAFDGVAGCQRHGAEITQRPGNTASVVELTEECETFRQQGFRPLAIALSQRHQTEIVQRPGDAPGVVDGPPQRQTLLVVRQRPLVLTAFAGHQAEEEEPESGQPVLAQVPADGDRLLAQLHAVAPIALIHGHGRAHDQRPGDLHADPRPAARRTAPRRAD